MMIDIRTQQVAYGFNENKRKSVELCNQRSTSSDREYAHAACYSLITPERKRNQANTDQLKFDRL